MSGGGGGGDGKGDDDDDDDDDDGGGGGWLDGSREKLVHHARSNTLLSYQGLLMACRLSTLEGSRPWRRSSCDLATVSFLSPSPSPSPSPSHTHTLSLSFSGMQPETIDGGGRLFPFFLFCLLFFFVCAWVLLECFCYGIPYRMKKRM